ncbi:MAG: DUF3526 domain-containing protein [Chitinophagaceae bacterium]|nr:DUF3526 domain-containing protein [Chitinophagaceae bacterium]
MRSIFRYELRRSFRDNKAMLLCLLIWLLLGLSFYINHVKVKQANTQVETALVLKKQQWLKQDPKHPHVAAHFGQFVFKPVLALSQIDPGVNAFAGNYVYLEPHRQNDFVFTSAQEQNASVRFGELTPALILQMLVPLLIIFMSFGSIASDRENGTLKLLTAQGAKMYRLISGKAFAGFALITAVILPVFLLLPVVSSDFRNNAMQTFPRGALLCAAYLLYYLLLSIIVVWISALVKNAKSSLLVSLCCWICFIIIIPKAIANVSADANPLISNEAFQSKISNDIKKGIDGHNPDEKRREELIAATLKKYNVDSLPELPVNIEGIVMQTAEEYSSKVYDLHFGKVQQTLRNQNKWSSYAAIVNPYNAIRNISMGLALTDVNSHIYFQKSAEAYRREFVKFLNDDMTYHSKAGTFFTYKLEPGMYAKVPVFKYKYPSVPDTLRNSRIEFLSLFAAIIILLLLVRYTSHKISVS